MWTDATQPGLWCRSHWVFWWRCADGGAVWVAITVVLAAPVKPQFAVLGVALFAARQWRLGGIAVIGVVISDLAAYLLWPRDFQRQSRSRSTTLLPTAIS